MSETATLEFEILGVRASWTFPVYSFDTIQRAHWHDWCRRRFSLAEHAELQHPESYECEGDE